MENQKEKNKMNYNLPTIWNYGNYTSDNYGAHCLAITIKTSKGDLDIYFSYKTPIAFRFNGSLIVRKNDWGTTTGKHLNAIDNGNKKERKDSETFEKLFNDILLSI
jgi:hypothetical protein